MDNQSAKQETTRPKIGIAGTARRRLAIAVALMVMGAVVVDPGILDGTDVAQNELLDSSGEYSESADEFEAIERLLAAAEQTAVATDDTSPEPATTPTVDLTAVATVETVPSLLIPVQTPATDSPLTIPSPEAMRQVSYPSETSPSTALQIPEQLVTVTTPAPEVEPPAAEPGIRLLGTIDEIQ